MRSLAISDLHFGAWTCDDVLSREFALGRLAPHLDDIDELILLGDVFDFLFSSVDYAFARADPFFDLVAEKMRGKRVVALAGNHDHHIVVRTLRSLVETRVATGAEGEELDRTFEAEHRSFFERFLERRLPGVETEMVYPTYMVGDVLLFHGHYLDAHMGGSLPNRTLTKATWTIAGGRPMERLTEEDYEAVIVPLTELLFTVAQMPRGCVAQQSFHRQFERIGKVLRAATAAQSGLRRARRRLGGRNGLRNGHVPLSRRAGRSSSGSLMRGCSPDDPVTLALSAYGEVVRNLGWDKLSDKLVFAHTHQPLGDAALSGCPGVRFWNTGSWVYEPSLASRDSYANYLKRAWPGTAVRIDTEAEAPELIEMLADQNPLNGNGDLSALRPERDQFSDRAASFAARL